METRPTASRATHVTCSRCKAAATVPFVPTPGRPVYCRSCFSSAARAPARSRPHAGARRPRIPGERKRMLDQGKKGHFVHDVRAVLADGETNLDETRRRAFIEMVFSRGARMGTKAALEFVREKRADDTLTDDEAARIEALVERYSGYR